MKPTIVILHGWSLSGERFSPLAEQLKKCGYRVLNPSLPGFGDSEPLTHPLVLSDYADFLNSYLEKEKSEKVIILGHSFGGRVALLFAAKYPDKVEALILTGTPGFSSLPWYRFWFFVAMAKMGKLIFSIPFLLPAQDAVRSFYYYIVGARDYTRANSIMRQTFKNVVSQELETSMKMISCSCLLLWGHQDQLVPLFIAKKMHKTIVHSELVTIPFTDHGVPYKKPEVFARKVDEFISHHI
jgi:pimeloyl-ACP methyl ester carboxylesterase